MAAKKIYPNGFQVTLAYHYQNEGKARHKKKRNQFLENHHALEYFYLNLSNKERQPPITQFPTL